MKITGKSLVLLILTAFMLAGCPVGGRYFEEDHESNERFHNENHERSERSHNENHGMFGDHDD
ncbi:MAG: hypothetical protein H8E38_06755 [SAR324 cluster bacterium]|nr:hypothetical protein [SAR324 cluster bacterium]MBL7034752.1 hypothetical protein [SAR324 cluster bacterium]